MAGTSTDTIWVRASDGIQYGAWPNGVTVIDAPVVTPVACAQINVMRARRARADLLSRGFYFFGQTNPKRSGGRETMWPKEPKRAARLRISQTNPTDKDAFRKRTQLPQTKPMVKS